MRLLICATSSAMAAFNAESEKNCRLRSFRNDEASRDLNRDFNLGFVARPVRAAWDNGSVVVGRHLGVGADLTAGS